MLEVWEEKHRSEIVTQKSNTVIEPENYGAYKHHANKTKTYPYGIYIPMTEKINKQTNNQSNFI